MEIMGAEIARHYKFSKALLRFKECLDLLQVIRTDYLVSLDVSTTL
jgi:hypothetical protein